MTDKAGILIESYNQALEKGYEEIFRNRKEEDILRLRDDKIKELLDKELLKWEDTPIHDLDNITPKQYFEGLDTIEKVVEVFIQAAKACDKGVPEPLLKRIIHFEEEITDQLIKFAYDFYLSQEEEEFYISLMSVNVLGAIKAEKAIKPLMRLIYLLDENLEILVEEISDALVNIGEPCTGNLIEAISSSEQIGYIDEYLLNTLVRIGKNHKSDEIYKCIKSSFNRMDDKILGALSLGDYGDGRAIPTLRGYIEKNINSIDNATYKEILAVIKRLGGNIEDLKI